LPVLKKLDKTHVAAAPATKKKRFIMLKLGGAGSSMVADSRKGNLVNIFSIK
jgi:hypothetical protein